TSTERAGCSMQAAIATRLNAQFFECVCNVLRQVGNMARGKAVRESLVDPEGAQHLGHVRLTRTEEAADPYTRLLMIAAQVAQVGGQDLVHTSLVLTFTDERLELITKGVERLLGQIVLHFGDPVVGQ